MVIYSWTNVEICWPIFLFEHQEFNRSLLLLTHECLGTSLFKICQAPGCLWGSPELRASFSGNLCGSKMVKSGLRWWFYELVNVLPGFVFWKQNLWLGSVEVASSRTPLTCRSAVPINHNRTHWGCWYNVDYIDPWPMLHLQSTVKLSW